MKNEMEWKDYVAQLSNADLMTYFRLCLRNGVDDKAALCDMEIEFRKHGGRW